MALGLNAMYYKHLKTIIRHKWYVLVECFKCGLYFQGIMHDISKLYPVEFFISAKYFQGSSSPINAERTKNGYSIAWLSHKARNKHHWQYWLDVDGGTVTPVDMPDRYIYEMACDFIGAGKAYNGKSGLSEPLEYWNSKIDKTYISKETARKFEILLRMYSMTGKLLVGKDIKAVGY